MHKHNGPFLSSSAIRRILEIHPFSGANREYLLQEAERRESWEREIEALVHGEAPASPAVAPVVAPSCETATAEITPLPY